MDRYFIIGIVVFLLAVFLFRSYTNNQLAVENHAKGLEFLSANKNQPGVEETGSGLQHLLLEAGSGQVRPVATDSVKVHYQGTLLDGTVFDSSISRGEPISFGLTQVIPGWTEGLQLMVVGEKRRFFIPSHLAYGTQAAGKIQPGSTLIFDVELLGVNE